MRYKVAVLCITYNHKDYVRQALDSIVMQKTKFPFIAVVGDDCSNDGTTEIVKEYAQKYPDIIKPIFHEKNTMGYQNFIDTANACDAEYVAWNECDDYWIDEYKLQRQVDFLDSHKDYSICFHPVKVVFENKSKKDFIFPKSKYKNKTFEINKLLEKNFIQTNSVMYRWIFNKDTNPIINNYPCYSLPGDWFLHLLHAEKGKIYCLPQVMSVYRRHEGGIWYNNDKNDDFYIKYGYCILNFYKNVQTHFGYINSNVFDLCKNILRACLKFKDFNLLYKILEEFSGFYEKAVSDEYALKDYKKYQKYKKLYNKLLIINIACVILILILMAILL